MDKKENLANKIFKLSFLLSHNLVNYKNIINKENIPPSHIKILYYLNYYRKAIISDLALAFGISKSNMTPIIDKLTEMNYIERKTCPDDKRKIYIVLTKDGASFLKEIDKKVVENIKIKLLKTSDKDLEEMKVLVENLNGCLKKIY